MRISNKLKFGIAAIILILIIGIFILFNPVQTNLPDINVFNEATSDRQLYEKLEDMCEGNDDYNNCSRAPLCGTNNDNKSNDDRVDIYDDYAEENTNTEDSPQSCVGDGKGCNGEHVPLCCYAMAATGDPLKCIGYWERLWCPTSLCDKIDENKSEACGGGKCQCGHAYGGYCGDDKDHPKGQVLTLCERLKREGVTGIVCASEVTPTPTLTPTPTPTGNQSPTPTPIIPSDSEIKCVSFNYTDAGENIMGTQQTINDQQTINISLVGQAQSVKPVKLDICWALAGQSNDYYIAAENWACEEFTNPQQVGTTSTAKATLANKNIGYLLQKLPNVTASQAKDFGLTFISRVYGGTSTNLYCSTNPAYNNGSGIMVDLTKQDISQKFVNSTCGLGNVGLETSKSCTLKLRYQTGQISGNTYDLNSDGKINIADFVVFAGHYKTKDTKIDFSLNGRVDIQDFELFRVEYVKARQTS